MIYSDDINKVCGLCVYASTIDGNDDKIRCEKKKKDMDITESACKKFKYDIFKKPVHKKRRLNVQFSADDFKL